MNAITPRRTQAHTEFSSARQAMNMALLHWLGTQPDPADVDHEISGTIAALRQLTHLTRETP